MTEYTPRYGDPAVVAHALARDIARRRRELDAELEARRQARQQGRKGRSLPGRGNQHLRDDRHLTDGMALALARLIGYPGESWAAERFIRDQDQEHDQEET